MTPTADKSLYGSKIPENKFTELNQLGGTEQRDTTSELMVVVDYKTAPGTCHCIFASFLHSFLSICYSSLRQAFSLGKPLTC